MIKQHEAYRELCAARLGQDEESDPEGAGGRKGVCVGDA
jgi:hypothetical protein